VFADVHNLFLENIQVVSPEFTFYDSSKLSMDDSLHIEKLLRAKMDFSFMFVLLSLTFLTS
jgi:vacuolar protein sorting-associated protein 13A/C